MKAKLRWADVLCLLALMLAASITSAEPGRREHGINESSMLVRGDIAVSAAGDVLGVVLDRPEKLPPGVRDFVTQSAAAWKFMPLSADDKVAATRSKMSVLLIAKRLPDKRYEIRIGSATFFEDRTDKPSYAKHGGLQPPPFPREAMRKGVFGRVFVALLINDRGDVEKAAVHRVDPGIRGNRAIPQQAMYGLVLSTLATAKQWQFTGKALPLKSQLRTITLPVEFSDPLIDPRNKIDTYGKWINTQFQRGEDRPIPWYDPEGSRDQLGAMPPGHIHIEGRGLKLLTPLEGSLLNPSSGG